jgi:DNA-binding transcriptional MerR regulator
MDAFTIKDLENLSGIKAHTIRIWEQRYSFIKPLRSDTNIRHYNNDELKTILNVALLNKFGFKISQIDRMTELDIKERILSLSQTEAQQERIINQMIQQMVDLNMDAFESILDLCIAQKGIEKTIIQVIFLFLERIGILWHTRHINPAHEHLVSNIIRRKLIVGIDNAVENNYTGKTALLFLPDGEYHEIGLLFVYFLLKTQGVKVLYLGANISTDDVAYVAKLKNPDFLYSHLTSVANNFKFDKFLSNMHSSVGQHKIIISGQVTQSCKKKPFFNIDIIKTFGEVTAFVASL